MTRVANDRSQEAINNLNNKVDQKRLALENRFLRWLCVVFVVALVVTILALPHLNRVDPHESNVQHLRDYSGTTEQRSASEPRIQRSSAFVNRGTPGQSWTF